MYLTKLDPKTGLVSLEGNDDGVLGIKAFRDIINDKKLGVECFTAIALTVDHLTKLGYYDEKDRPRAAMEEVTGDRDRWVWNQEKIQVALVKYDELQYDPTIEEGKIHYQRKVTKLKEYKESEEYHSKPRKKDDEERVFKNPSTLAGELRKINEDIKEYEKTVQGKKLYDNSPVATDYSLSRLEQKILKKNSFYKEKR